MQSMVDFLYGIFQSNLIIQYLQFQGIEVNWLNKIILGQQDSSVFLIFPLVFRKPHWPLQIKVIAYLLNAMVEHINFTSVIPWIFCNHVLKDLVIFSDDSPYSKHRQYSLHNNSI